MAFWVYHMIGQYLSSISGDSRWPGWSGNPKDCCSARTLDPTARGQKAGA